MASSGECMSYDAALTSLEGGCRASGVTIGSY